MNTSEVVTFDMNDELALTLVCADMSSIFTSKLLIRTRIHNKWKYIFNSINIFSVTYIGCLSIVLSTLGFLEITHTKLRKMKKTPVY